MQKWMAIGFAALTAIFVAAPFVARNSGPPAGAHRAADAGADASRATSAAADAGESPDAEAADEPPPAPSSEAPAPAATTDAGATLLTGEVPPGLAADAPKSVVFGVILVRYKGVQVVPGDPPGTRTREAALELAKQLAQEAKQDFKAAVAKGDKPGSMENAGRIPRGILEPAPEYVLFSLPKEGVSDPVDTPRGFWIARRIE